MGPEPTTRSDKTARSYLAGVTFAAALIWLKSGLSNTPWARQPCITCGLAMAITRWT